MTQQVRQGGSQALPTLPSQQVSFANKPENQRRVNAIGQRAVAFRNSKGGSDGAPALPPRDTPPPAQKISAHVDNVSRARANPPRPDGRG